MVTVLEHCQVTPPPGSVPETSLPLTFFDILWLYFSPIQRLIFYEYSSSKTNFIETIIPQLKNSLSLSLKHFFPLAGNIIVHLNSNKAEIRYMDGNFVSLTFAESSSSSSDFNDLTVNYARKAIDFHSLVPQLSVSIKTSEYSAVIPVFALQVTLFPNVGICVGITNHHSAGDASSIFSFMKAWASITKHGGEDTFLSSGSLPFYDRTVIKDAKRLDTIFLSQIGKTLMEKPENHRLPSDSDKVRATFVMSRANTQRLKKLVLEKRPKLTYVSTFTVVCGYVWACMAKSRAASGDKVDEDEVEHFICLADCRARLDPPIPDTYFGNCLVPGCAAPAKSSELMEEDGFLVAAEVIGQDIGERLHNEEGVLRGAETWLSGSNHKIKRGVGVAGSTKFNYYDIDFGWGKPKKFEFVSIDFTGALSLNGCKDSDGAVEVGLSLPKPEMDFFTTIFNHHLT